MPLDPFRGFDAARKLTKDNKAPFSSTLDAFDAQQEGKMKFQRDMALEREKYNIKAKAPLNPLEEARRGYLISQTKKNEGEFLSPSLQKQKNIATYDLLSMVETNKIKRNQIDRANASLSSLPGGRLGKVQVDFIRQFQPDHPMLADWQNLKSVLTDVQLMNVAKTKGAISDREMELFAQASANDDLISVSRMGTSLKRLSDFLDANEKSAINAYRINYGEDPTQFMSGNTLQNFASSQSSKSQNVEQQYDDLVDSLVANGMDTESARDQADKEFGY